MAELKKMYPAQANSPETTLTGSLTTSGTTLTVLNGSVLPEAPNILTIGADTTTAETVLMTAKSGNTLTVERGYNGTTPRAWEKGDIIARYFTAADHTAIVENIDALNKAKPDKPTKPTAGNLAAVDAEGNYTDSGKKPDDFAAAKHSHAEYAEKVKTPTAGNLAGLDASGNLTDSGKKPADFAAATHSHDAYANKVKSATAGNFATLTATGDLVDSGKKPADYAAAGHSHAGYAQILIAQNLSVAATSWVGSSTYPTYPFSANVTMSGVTAQHVPEVTFAPADAAGGNFAPVALAGSGIVTIYAAAKPAGAITIPTIKCVKAV